MPPSKPQVTKSDILNGLRQLGISPGSQLIVHSSLKSFGIVDGGALGVIGALMEAVTADGTILMPSFNHGQVFSPGESGIFDPKRTKTINGAIPDCFWRMAGVQRSLNPTHAFAAWGKNARRYTENHHRTLTMGPDSPLGLLWLDGGNCLLLGVGFSANTYHHVVETSTGAPCLGLRTEAYPVRTANGEIKLGRTWSWRKEPCPITDHTRYQTEMERHGYLSEVMIGNCRAVFFRLQDCYDAIAPLLENGINEFPSCRRCTIRPRQVPQTVPSDWDPVRKRPLPYSTAWTY